MNVNELILDRVRSMTFTNLEDGSVIGRLTSIEDSSLNTSAEGEDITDAVGALITTVYRAKTAEYSASNSLLSLDLAALQFGSEKKVADSTNKIIAPASETLTANSGGTIELAHVPAVDTLKYIYKLESKKIAQKYSVDTAASAETFSVSGKTITVPTGVTGTFYVEYGYETESAVEVVNNTDKFPDAVGVKIFVVFKDMCNENIKYSGTIVAKKGKLDPSSVELALTSTGKHPFTIKFMKDYCDENADLFSIIVAE